MTDVTQDQVAAYLEKNAPDIAALLKKNLTVGDVHASTALGNDKKAKPFKALIEGKRKEAEVETGDIEKAFWAMPLDIVKAEPDQQMIFGWASVAEKNGQLIIDKQNDVIHPNELEKAAYGFVLAQQEATASKVQKFLEEEDDEIIKLFERLVIQKAGGGLGNMHEEVGQGRLVESMIFTKQKQKILGIDLGLVGWWTGFKVDSPELWAAHKRGERPEFSIGGRASRVAL